MARQDGLLTINEASKLLGVSKLTLRNWDKSGKLKAVRLGRRQDRRYRRIDLEALLKAPAVERGIDRAELESFLAHHTMWTEEGPGLPLTLEYGVREMVETDNFKPSLSHCVFLYENNQIIQYLSVEESAAACKGHLKTLHEAPELVDKFWQDCKTQFDMFNGVITRFNFLDLSKLSNTELNASFEEFNDALKNFWHVTLVVEPYNSFLDHEYIQKFESAVGEQRRAREAFPAVSLPTEYSFVSQERRDLLRIITTYLKSSKERNVLLRSSNAEYLAHLKLTGSPFLDALYKHQQDYFWIQNSYANWVVLGVHDFLSFIRDIVQEQSLSALTKELHDLENEALARANQRALEEGLGLSAEIKKELAFLRKIVWTKDERKRYVLRMLHVLYGFIAEYGKRTGVSSHLLTYALAGEMPKILAQDFNLAQLEQRAQRMFFVSQSGHRAGILTANDALFLKEKLLVPHTEVGHEVIHGSIACKGPKVVVSGPVRVVLDVRQAAFEEGEILVTSMTRPEFVPLMRKARAIITDEGGITCHAAIVSREMNKSCIIGTKNATKILKTGDHIEMRMNHGYVKIL